MALQNWNFCSINVETIQLTTDIWVKVRVIDKEITCLLKEVKSFHRDHIILDYFEKIKVLILCLKVQEQQELNWVDKDRSYQEKQSHCDELCEDECLPHCFSEASGPEYSLEENKAVVQVDKRQDNCIEHKHANGHEQGHREVSEPAQNVVEPLQVVVFTLEANHHPVNRYQDYVEWLG